MNNNKAFKRIAKSLDGAPSICTSGKYVKFSDLHYNKEGGRNDSVPFLDLQRRTVFPYYAQHGFRAIIDEGFDLIEAGSYDAIWDYFPNRDNIRRLVSLCDYYIPGNHERKIVKVKHESLSGLQFADAVRIYNPSGDCIGLIQHGYQADKYNHGGKITSAVNWVVGHVWANWQDSHRASSNIDISNEIEKTYWDFAEQAGTINNKAFLCCIGHTHHACLYKNAGLVTVKLADEKSYDIALKCNAIYANSGTWTRGEEPHCIEIEHEVLRLVRWDLNGNRIVEKEINLK